MTGFGNASLQTEGVHVSSEIKSVNNRYLKISVRMPDSVARFEAEIEKLVRSRVTRGSVQLSIRVRFTSGQSEYRIDQDLLRSFQRQLAEISGDSKGNSADSWRTAVTSRRCFTDRAARRICEFAVASRGSFSEGVPGSLRRFSPPRRRIHAAGSGSSVRSLKRRPSGGTSDTAGRYRIPRQDSGTCSSSDRRCLHQYQ